MVTTLADLITANTVTAKAGHRSKTVKDGNIVNFTVYHVNNFIPTLLIVNLFQVLTTIGIRPTRYGIIFKCLAKEQEVKIKKCLKK